MRFDLEHVEKSIAYKLLAATVMPRPIAWIVTLDATGQLKAPPYSFFNAMGASPPTVAIGLLPDASRGFKDTARNILETGEFVINLVPEALASAMNITALDAPAEVDELTIANLSTSPCEHVSPPRISASPVAFECVSLSSVVTGPQQTIVIGRVLAVHVQDEYVKDADRAYIDTPALDLVGRSYGSDYVRTRDTFSMERPTWATWNEKSDS